MIVESGSARSADGAVDPAVLSCACADRTPVNLADWWRIGLGVVIAVNSMVVSLAIDVSEASELERTTVYAILGGLAALACFLLAPRLILNAFRDFRSGRLTIEAMFLAGIAAAFCASAVAAARGVGDAYFEVVVILLVVYSLGQQLTRQARDRALRSARQWIPELTHCRVLDDSGIEREVSIEELAVGQRVVVNPGQTIPIDGVIETGTAFVREAELSGEHFAVSKGQGAPVWAGTQSLDGRLVVRASKTAGERRIDEISEAIEEACASPARFQRQVDRVAQWFLPVIMLVSGATFVFWSVSSGWATGLFNAMAVLLVACPCALGLATPLAVWTALGRLGSRGFLVRGGDVVERIAAVDTAAFDKTGTLTEARTAIVEIVVDPPPHLSRSAVLEMVSFAEEASGHPVASAFGELAIGSAGGCEILELEVLAGVGVRARVGGGALAAEHVVEIGSADKLFDAGDEVSVSELKARLTTTADAHEIGASIDGRPVMLARVAERLRSSWTSSLAELRRMGLATAVMSGDIEARVAPTGADRALASMTPEEKKAEVDRLISDGHRVLFVGDGVNDAAALAASHVGVGMTLNSQLAAEVADVAWFGTDLDAVPWAIGVAREAIATVRGNLAIALAYNVVGLTIAAAGWLHPVAATLLMTCSSLVVTWRSLALLAEEAEESTTPVPGDDRSEPISHSVGAV